MQTATQRMKAISFSGIRTILEKVKQVTDSGTPIIYLDIGCPDFDTLEQIKNSVYQAFRNAETHYTPSYVIMPLREAIADKPVRENPFDFDQKNESCQQVINQPQQILGLTLLRPLGGFYVYIDVSGLTEDAYQLAGEILQHEHVVPVSRDKKHIRFSYGCSKVSLTAVRQRLQRCFLSTNTISHYSPER